MAVESSILLFAATEDELRACQIGDDIVGIVSGVGPAATSLAVCRAILHYHPHIVIQAGIAGAINPFISIGDAVMVCTDYFGDMGSYRDNTFTPFDTIIYSGSGADTSLRDVRGVTVSTACNPLISRANADVESMEGAAFFMTAGCLGVRSFQVRTVSNYIDTPRNEWRISEALEALPGAVSSLLGAL